MKKKNIVIVIPGFEYDSNGPVYIDKLKIDASINGEPIDVFTHGFTSSKSKEKLDEWDDVSPNNIVYNLAVFNNLEDKNIRSYWAGSDEVDLTTSSLLIPYSKTLQENGTIKVPYSFFNDILEIKDNVYHHYLTVYNSSDIQAKQNDFEEHDGICWLALDEINTDIIFNITFYSFVGEDEDYKKDNNYVIVGLKTMYYNPATSGLEGGLVDFCDLSFQQYYNINDTNEGYTIELKDPIVYKEDIYGVKKIYTCESKEYKETEMKLRDDLLINIYPLWAITDDQNSGKLTTYGIRRQEVDSVYDKYYLFNTNKSRAIPAPSNDSFRIYTTHNLLKGTIIPLVFKKDRPDWTGFYDTSVLLTLNILKNYFNNLYNETWLSATLLIEKGVLKSNIIFNDGESSGSLINTPFDFGASGWSDSMQLRRDLFNNQDIAYVGQLRNYMGLSGVLGGQSTTQLSNVNSGGLWPFNGSNKIGKYLLIKDSKLTVGSGTKDYNYTIIEKNSNLYNSTYIYKDPVSIIVNNLSETPSYIIWELYGSNPINSALLSILMNDIITYIYEYKVQKEHTHESAVCVHPVKQEDIFKLLNIKSDKFNDRLSGIQIKLDFLYSTLNTYWLPNTLFAIDLDRSKLTFSKLDPAYKIKPLYIYTNKGTYKGLYKNTVKSVLVNSNVDTIVNYLTYLNDSNLAWLVGLEKLQTPGEMGYSCSYYNEKDFYKLVDNTLNIGKSITLESGLYAFNCNFISEITNTCQLDVSINGKNYELIAGDQSIDSRKLICFYLKNKTTVKISKLTISSREIKDIYIRNMGLYKVNLDDGSLYSELFNKGFGTPENDFTDLNTENFKDLINYIIFPACYVYAEAHNCFDKSYHFTWLPDKPIYKIEGSYTLTDEYKDIVSDTSTQCLDAFNSIITIRE